MTTTTLVSEHIHNTT